MLCIVLVAENGEILIAIWRVLIRSFTWGMEVVKGFDSAVYLGMEVVKSFGLWILEREVFRVSQ